MHTDVRAELSVFTEVCKAVGSELAHEALGYLSQGDQASILKLKVDASEYMSVEAFANDYLICNLLSKWKDLHTGIDTRSQALSSWLTAEDQCSLTNKRFREFERRPFFSRVEGVISDARRKIAQVLGPLKVSTALSMCRWSGGATYDTRRGFTTSQKHATKKYTVTIGALPYFKAVLESDPAWSSVLLGIRPEGRYSLLPSNFKIVRGNRFLTVPKSAKTDRCIAAEPLANSFLQQGVGRYIRHRLKRFHVDLDDQSINQKLAARAAFEGLATLDLSMASDTLSYDLVRTLLPSEWFDFLCALRSPESELEKGKWTKLAKFSSMGNAFTFELESLIFWALCRAQADVVDEAGIVSVYGDDIIVHRDVYDLVKETLAWCGFTLNDEKSFKEGWFFESCGKHYFKGCEVTPVYQKESVDSLPQAIRLANRLVRWSQRIYGVWRHRIIYRAHRVCFDDFKFFKVIPYRPMIPLGEESDDGFLVPTSWLGEFDPNHGFKCMVLAPSPRLVRGFDVAMYAYKLRSPYSTNSHPKGWCFHGVEGRYTTQTRYIHAKH